MEGQNHKIKYWRQGTTIWKANFICKNGGFVKITDSQEPHQTFVTEDEAEQFLKDLYKTNHTINALNQTNANTPGCIF